MDTIIKCMDRITIMTKIVRLLNNLFKITSFILAGLTIVKGAEAVYAFIKR